MANIGDLHALMIKNEASNDKGCPVAEEITVTGMALGVLSSLLLSPCGEFDDDDDDDDDDYHHVNHDADDGDEHVIHYDDDKCSQ